MNDNKKEEIIVFKDGEVELEVNVSPDEETVWLTQEQMGELFARSKATINEHINNIFNEGEVEEKISVSTKFGISEFSMGRPTKYYNLDVIISVGYRVKSKRGITFRKWANSILKQYLLKGYALNQKKLNLPDYNKIIELLDNYRSYDGNLELSNDSLLNFLLEYKLSLEILDNYDHQSIVLKEGVKDTYKLEYEECLAVIRKSSFSNKSDLFAIERDDSFKSSLATIYQTFDGEELYPTLENKAANLLYLITKNHSFIDGNKRIAAIMLLYFLARNKSLYINHLPRISNETLATLTILAALSKPEDKENIVNLIQLLLIK